MNKIKIILIGNIINTYFLLKEILKYKNKFEIIVLTNKNFHKSDYFDLVCFCKKKKLTYYLTKNINDNKTLNFIKKNTPDFIFCFGWSQILNNKILKQAKKFSIGYHPSMLPKNRGKHPLIWSIALGLKEIGSTFFKMSVDVDQGDIIDQKTIKIINKDNATTVYKKMNKTSSKQIKEILQKIIQSNLNLKKRPTNENKTNIWRKRYFNDGLIDWRMSAKNIQNLVRSLNYPYPNASFKYNNKYVKLTEVKIVKKRYPNMEFGKIIKLEKNKPIVKCGDYALRLIKFYPIEKFKKGSYL